MKQLPARNPKNLLSTLRYRQKRRLQTTLRDLDNGLNSLVNFEAWVSHYPVSSVVTSLVSGEIIGSSLVGETVPRPSNGHVSVTPQSRHSTIGHNRIGRNAELLRHSFTRIGIRGLRLLEYACLVWLERALSPSSDHQQHSAQ